MASGAKLLIVAMVRAVAWLDERAFNEACRGRSRPVPNAAMPRGARPPDGRSILYSGRFMAAKYILVAKGFQRCKSARPRRRSGAARRRVPRLDSALRCSDGMVALDSIPPSEDSLSNHSTLTKLIPHPHKQKPRHRTPAQGHFVWPCPQTGARPLLSLPDQRPASNTSWTVRSPVLGA